MITPLSFLHENEPKIEIDQRETRTREEKMGNNWAPKKIFKWSSLSAPQSSLFFYFPLLFSPLFLSFFLSCINCIALNNTIIMVHLATVKKDDQVLDPKSRVVDSIPGAPDESDFNTNVYGSHFAVDHLSQHEMPEREMPRQIAARLIKDELSLDGNPKLK